MRLLWAALLMGGLVFAQEAEREKQKLEARVVVGTRTEEDPQAVPGWVSVVDEKDVALWQPFTLEEVLFGLPGVWVAGAGGFSYQELTYIRGAKPTHTLFLLEGIRLNDPTLAQFDLSSIAPLGLRQVEVLRGTSSALYGSDALGGVVLLRLAHPSGPSRTRLRLLGGRYDTAAVDVTYLGSENSTRFLLACSSVSCDNRYPYYNTKRNSIVLSVAAASDQRDWSIVVAATDRRSQWPFDIDFFNNKLEWDKNITHHNTLAVAGYKLKWKFNKNFSSTFLASITSIRSHFLNGPDTTGGDVELEAVSSAVRAGGAIQGTWNPLPRRRRRRLRKNFDLKAIFGGEFHHTDAQSMGWDPYGNLASWKKPNDTLGIYGQLLIKSPLVVLQAGIRFDSDSLYGSSTSPRVGVSIPAGKMIRTTRHGWNLILKGSWGKGFRAPSLSEVSDVWVGNKDLKAEHSRGGDAGLLLSSPILSFEAVYFRNHIEDMIAYSFSTWKLENIDAARIEGVELAIAAKPLKTLNLRCSFTHQNPRDLSTKQYLPAVSRNFGTLALQWLPIKTLRLGLLVRLAEPYGEANYLSVRGTPRGKVGNVKEVTLLMGWKPKKWLSVEARVENLLNENYLEKDTSPRANDRALYMGLVLLF